MKAPLTATMVCSCLMMAGGAFAIDFTAPSEKLGGDFEFTEGPLWVAASNELLFSDIPANRIVSFRDGKLAADFFPLKC